MTKLKEDFEASGGVFKEWRIGDIFLLKSPKKKFNANAVIFGSKHPYVVRTSQNNGVRAYLDEDEKYLNDAKTISFGQDTATMFYQEKPYFTGDKIKIMRFKDGELTSLTACYLLASMYKSFSLFSWGTTSFNEDVLNGVLVNLPTFNGEPSYSYMEQYISLLEEEKMLQVDKFLKDSGLNDTTLTAEETSALEKFRKGEVKFEERKIGELFDVLTSNKRFDANKVEVLKKGEHPYIVRTALNNGTKGFLNENEEFLNDGNTISFGQDTATMFYQEKPYFTGDKIKILKHKDDIFNEVNALFFLTAMNKAFSNFSWGSSSFNVDVLEAQKTKLPICSNSVNGTIDYTFMQHFISALEKLVMRGVVKYKDEMLNAYDKALDFAVAAEQMLNYGQKSEF